MNIYSLRTFDNSIFIYTIPSCPVQKLETKSFVIYYGDCEINLFLGENPTYESINKNSKGEKVLINSEYSEYSQLEDIEYCIGFQGYSQDERKKYKKKAESLKKKIEENKKRDKC